MARLTLRLPDDLLDELQGEAARAGFTNVSDYARRKLATAQPLSRVEATLGRVEQSLARIEGRLEDSRPEPLIPSRPQTFSSQFGRMVDVDADGREIPPT